MIKCRLMSFVIRVFSYTTPNVTGQVSLQLFHSSAASLAAAADDAAAGADAAAILLPPLDDDAWPAMSAKYDCKAIPVTDNTTATHRQIERQTDRDDHNIITRDTDTSLADNTQLIDFYLIDRRYCDNAYSQQTHKSHRIQ